MKRASVNDRLIARTVADPVTGCWNWTGCKEQGYGRMGNGAGRLILAHRASYEMHVGVIPEGLVIDHLCRNRACVNPKHLEPVSPAENMYRGVSPAAQNKRKQICARGHKFTEGNTYIFRGQRKCRECNKFYSKQKHDRRRAREKGNG